GFGGGRPRRVVAEQLAPVIDHTIPLAVEREKGVDRASRRPRKRFCLAIAIQVEADALRLVGEGKAVAEHVDQDGRAIPYAITVLRVLVIAGRTLYKITPAGLEAE